MTTISHATQFIIANNLNIASRDEEYDPEYTEFMRRISPTDRQEIERNMAALEGGDQVSGLVKTLNKKWGIEDPIIAHPDMPYIALLAFKQKKISRFQIGTLLHFWAAIQHHKEAGKGAFAPEVIEFFNEDGRTVNPRAVLLLRETFENGHENFGLRTKEEWDCFIAEIGKLPRSEQQFFKIPCLLDFGPPGYHKSGKTILERVEFSGGYAAFGLLRDEKHLLLETMGMAQAYINATKKGSEKSAQINIVIGHSSPEDIEKNGFDHIRDVAVHFPGIKELPRYPDGFYGPWIYFTKHDFFHAKALDAIGQQ